MKLWVKYSIGILLGLALAFALPEGAGAQTIAFLSEICIRLGRYIVPPLVFFSVSVGVFRLRETHHTLKTCGILIAAMAAPAVVLTVFSLCVSVIVPLPHIPISVESAASPALIDAAELLRRVFPYSGFSSLLDGVYLLPVFVFAGLAGAGCSLDAAAAKQAVSLFNSLSHVCYNVASIFTDILSVGMIAVMFVWTTQCFAVQETGVFVPFILLLLGLFIVITFVLYPLALHLLFPSQIRYPLRVLYASLCPVLVAFFSGDANFTLPYLMRHGKESLGIRGRIGSVSFTVFSIFSRSGSAVVTAAAFITILHSYSSLSIAAADIVWIALVCCALSFVLGSIPSGAPFVSLTVLCALYGRGFESGYLLFNSAAPIICSFAAAIDAVTAMFGTYAAALKLKLIDYRGTKVFI